ncbi:MAG: phasin family protein [Maricaulaceae bacterium]
MAKDKKRSSTATARRIWLAGVGAYGRGLTEAQEAIKDITGKGSDVFEELVMKGQMIEKVVEVKGKDMMGKAQIPTMPDLNLDERIKKMRSRLNRGEDEQIDDLEARMDVIEAKLDRVLELLEPKAKTPAAKPAAKRKAPAKKPAPKRKAPVKTQRTPKKTVAEKMADKKASIEKT